MAKRIYFAFHYQDVIDFRANVVRTHNALQGSQKAGYFDASIWEESKKKGDLALKRMINSELQNTSVTTVLIGSETYARRWVQYEIMKSIERENRVIGVHINKIPCKNKRTKSSGPNPFDYLGLVIDETGTKGTPTIWNGSAWVYYQDLSKFKINKQPSANCGKHFKLSHWLPTYDWIWNDGFNKFSSWVA